MKSSVTSTLELHEVSGTGADGDVVSAITAGFAPGRFHVLRGPTGGGKAVLLRLLGLLQLPEDGEVFVQGGPTRELRQEARAELRSQRFGFVFGAPFLLSAFTVIENVAMPLFKASHVTPDEARRRTESLLAFVGLPDAAETVIEDLPQLAQYRVALARGLINEPAFLLVEDLDGVLAGADLQTFMELLHRAQAELGTTIIATATPKLSLLWPHRVLDIAGGMIVGDVELSPEVGL